MTASDNQHGKTESASITRRRFIAGTGASVLAFTVLKPGLVGGAEANSKIDIGLIGCGNRGKWIADLFQKNGGYNFVAVADYFQDHADEAGEKFNVPAANRYHRAFRLSQAAGAEARRGGDREPALLPSRTSRRRD